MKVIKKHEVLDRVFDSEEEAIKYEDAIRNNLELRIRNLILYDHYLLKYGSSWEAIELTRKLCKSQIFKFGKYKGVYISDVMFFDYQYITWCLKNIPNFKLNKGEEVLYNADWSYIIASWSLDSITNRVVDIPSEYPDFKLLYYEKYIF